MYSHYGNYNSTTGGAAVSTQQPGMSWNGQQWSKNSPLGTTSSYSTYHNSFKTVTPSEPAPTTRSLTTANLQSQRDIPGNPVQTYTQYYHSWTKQSQEQEKYAQCLPQGSQKKAETQRLADWSKYYADQSSRAAHHFYNNPNAMSAPFDLPPSPLSGTKGADQSSSPSGNIPVQPVEGSKSLNDSSCKTQAFNHTSSQSKFVSGKSIQVNHEIDNSFASTMASSRRGNFHTNDQLDNDESSNRRSSLSSQTNSKSSIKLEEVAEKESSTANQIDSSQPPDGLKIYVHRCLTDCTSDEQARLMHKEIEFVIARALQEGNLHSTDWENKALIELNNEPSAKKPKLDDNFSTSVLKHRDQNMTRVDNYYGPASTQTTEGSSNDEFNSSKVLSYGHSRLPKGEIRVHTKTFDDDNSFLNKERDQKFPRTFFSTNDKNSSSFSPYANPTSKRFSFQNQQLVENDSYYGRSNASKSESSENKEIIHDPAMQNYYGNGPHVERSISSESVSNRNFKNFSLHTQHLPENEDFIGKASSGKRKLKDSGCYNSLGSFNVGDQKTHPSQRFPSQSSFCDQNLLKNDSYYGNMDSNVARVNGYCNIKTSKKLNIPSTANHLSKKFSSRNKQLEQSVGEELNFISLSPSKEELRLNSKKSVGLDRSSKALAKRANRFKTEATHTKGQLSTPNANGRFDKYMGKGTIGGSQKQLDDEDYEKMTVKGTCESLEKNYLRLTAPPRAELVRPQIILLKHLKNLKSEWKADKKRDYDWFCSQLKAIRQDCTVQRLRDSFTVDVYETHAKIALEEDDLNEYNQCQTQLKELYTILDDAKSAKNANEFIAYRLIYYVFLTGNKKYDGGSSDLFKIMLSLTSEQREDPAIKHALKVRSSVSDVDYHKFFMLYRRCPNYGSYLMNYLAPHMRYLALQRIVKAYRPSVDVSFVVKELGISDIKDGIKWMMSCGCILSHDGKEWKTKDSIVHESDLDKKSSSLI